MGTKTAVALASPGVAREWFGRGLFRTSTCMVASDLATVIVVTFAAVALKHVISPSYSVGSFVTLLPFEALIILAFAFEGLYPGCLLHPADEIRKIFHSVCAVLLAWTLYTFLFRSSAVYSRSVFLFIWPTIIPAVVLSRYLTRFVFSAQSWWGVRAIVLGSGTTATRIIKLLDNKRFGVNVVGMLASEPAASWPAHLPPYLGALDQAPALAENRFAQYAIIAIPGHENAIVRQTIQDFCRGFSHVVLVPDMTGICSLGVTAREIGGEVGLELRQRLFNRTSAFVKRGIDLTLSATCMLLLLPLLLVIALAIKCTSPGPVLFRQRRYGRHGKLFAAFKFRTMIRNADLVLADYLATNPEMLFEWDRNHKLRNDPRVTLIGKWLRRFSLDELPQLINVLVGQMSLVGPRPIVKAEIEKYGRTYDLYSRVRPGMSGLWQVSGRNNTTYAERVVFDEYYVHNWSIWLDIYILARTVKIVATGHGAY